MQSIDVLTTWQVVKAFAIGSYQEGDVFVNELGQELAFDGERIIGIEQAPLNSTWVHVADHAEWKKRIEEGAA